MGRVALLLNPESGSGEAAAVERELWALGTELSVHPIQEPESATETKPERIAVAGGDGSIGPAAEVAVVVEACSRARLVTLAYGLRSGRLEAQAGVHSRRAPSFRVEVETGTAFNVDGELCTRSGAVEFTVDPRPVELVVG